MLIATNYACIDGIVYHAHILQAKGKYEMKDVKIVPMSGICLVLFACCCACTSVNSRSDEEYLDMLLAYIKQTNVLCHQFNEAMDTQHNCNLFRKFKISVYVDEVCGEQVCQNFADIAEAASALDNKVMKTIVPSKFQEAFKLLGTSADCIEKANRAMLSCCVASDVFTKAHFFDLSHAWMQESFKQQELVMHVLSAEVFQESPPPIGAN